MPTSKASLATDHFQERLAFISRIYALVGPVGLLVAIAVLQFTFTNQFDQLSPLHILSVLFTVTIIIGTRALLRNPSRTRLATEYIVMTGIGVFLYGYLLPFASPYIIAPAIFAILIYFDFGKDWAALSLSSQYGAFIVASTIREPTLANFLESFGYAIGGTALAIFIMKLQSLARQEIISIEENNGKALQNEQQIQSLINNISDGVVAVDHSFHVMMYNAAALDVLDINTNIRGKSIAKYLQPIDSENQSVDIKKMLHGVTTQINNRDLRITYNDGSTANLYLGIAPIYLGYGKAVNNGYTIVIRDITREKSLEDERNEFISVVSHELRTPIAITEGNISNAEYVADKTGDITAIKAALKESHNQVLFLASMINDLSTLSRAERGVLEVEVEPINVSELSKELVSNYTPQAEAKGLAFNLELDEDVTTLLSSKLYSREILQNFITNAIKYTEQGSVTLHVTNDPKGVNFAISDTGIGISKGDQQKVFDKFFRSEDFRTRKANGTGLGLYVTMKLTRLIHAKIDIQSELNKGSTFTIFMPNLN